MRQRRIVLVGDEGRAHRVLHALRAAGLAVQSLPGQTAVGAILMLEPDLILVAGDVLSRSLELCRALQRMGAAPVVGLLATASEREQILWFAAGAADAVHSTMGSALLVARIRARLAPLDEDVRAITVGALRLEPSTMRLLCAGRPLTLSDRECRLLHVFMRHPAQVFDRPTLLAIGWDEPSTERALESALSRLRRRVRAVGGPSIAVPVHGVGYRLGVV